MKLITSLLGSMALTFVMSAVAQEESPSASPEAQAPAAAQETAAPAPAAPEAKAAESPAAPKKEAASKTAAGKSPSPAATAASGKRMTVEAALKDDENRWEAATAKHDVATMGSLVADDFTGVYHDGKIMNHSSVMSEAKKDRDTYTTAVNEKLAVHSFGPNVAVVVGTAHEKGTAKDGKPFDRRFRFTDTWVERGGRWQCVASEVMLVH